MRKCWLYWRSLELSVSLSRNCLTGNIVAIKEERNLAEDQAII